ncbi:MAG: putative porin, partial [Solimonas sp.]
PKGGDVRIVYVPDSEKQKMQAEIQQKVLETAKNENWAEPHAYPTWLKRISFDGDLRLRYELDDFDSGNSPFFVNYQAINSGAPYDINPLTNQSLPALLNTTEDRNMMRVRARFGLKAKVSDDLTAGLRFSSGNSTNPVSTNQTLGTDFNKPSLVIDRAYLNYKPATGWSIWGGRMPSPWLSTELIWDDDLNFDGVAVQFKSDGQTLSPFVTVGAFPVENTAFDFPANNSVKVGSRDKWLYGAQIGSGWRIAPKIEARAGIAYYYFDKMQGETSSLCPAWTSSVACDTDNSRSGFIQKGNTLFALRDLAADPDNPNGPQYQYFGLASPFHILDFTAKLDIALNGPLRLLIDGEYLANLGYSRSEVRKLTPVNNYDPDDDLRGGSRGFAGQFTVGYPKVREYAQWNVTGGYRYLESDAVVDAFTDSDFHLGGTNAKGFYIGGSFGFTQNAWLTLRWLSATEISGSPLAVDVLQFDVNAKF